MIYEIPIYKVKNLEQLVSKHIRKWLKLHHTTTDICLYSDVSPCPLPLTSLTSIFKSAKVSAYLQLRDSSDKSISNHWKPTQSLTEQQLDRSKQNDPSPTLFGGKWDVREAVEGAESAIKFDKIIGHTKTSRAGFGLSKPRDFHPKTSNLYRKSISNKVRQQEDDNLSSAKAVSLAVQGEWTKWCNYIKNDFSWKTLHALPRSLIGFCLKSTYNVLPSPDNLKRWKLDCSKSCVLCNRTTCTTSHVLGACKYSLHQKRFNYRHDSVLQTIEEHLNNFLAKNKIKKPRVVKRTTFVKEGTCNKKIKSSNLGLLQLSDDWTVLTDLNSAYCFPLFITTTDLRPDIVIYLK